MAPKVCGHLNMTPMWRYPSLTTCIKGTVTPKLKLSHHLLSSPCKQNISGAAKQSCSIHQNTWNGWRLDLKREKNNQRNIKWLHTARPVLRSQMGLKKQFLSWNLKPYIKPNPIWSAYFVDPIFFTRTLSKHSTLFYSLFLTIKCQNHYSH